MAIRHPRSGIAHDLFDALLRFAALAMDVAVLAVSRMPIGADGGSPKRHIDGFPAFRAQAFSILRCIVIAPAVYAPDSLERFAILFELRPHAP